MFRFPFALLCALLVISTVDYAVARKSFGYGGRHSYPKSSGHSGAGSHSYPSNGGLSGGSHGYPSSGGSHGYPSSGGSGSHSYPASSGMSGHGSAGSSNTHHSGSHGYPASTGLSGNKPASSVTNVHHHYHYSPPQQISYASHVGAAPVSYPVYHGTPPTYVYQYKDSGMIISVCWVAGAGVGLLPLFGWHAAVESAPSCYFVEVMDYNYLLFLYFATIVTPSAILAAFYAHIYRVVVKQMSEVMTVEGSQGRMASGTMLRVLGAAQKREVKATQNLAIIVFFFIICWIPLYTINAIKAFMPDLDIPNPLTYISIIVSHLNSAINPLLYAYHLKDFRSALKGLILFVLGRGVPLPAAYMPPIPVRRTALERCNALRERPKIYVNSPVWLQQREAELEEIRPKSTACTPVPESEPFMDSIGADGSSGRLTPEVKENDGSPYLIDGQDCLQSPYKKVEDLFRRVRSFSADHS